MASSAENAESLAKAQVTFRMERAEERAERVRERAEERAAKAKEAAEEATWRIFVVNAIQQGEACQSLEPCECGYVPPSLREGVKAITERLGPVMGAHAVRGAQTLTRVRNQRGEVYP